MNDVRLTHFSRDYESLIEEIKEIIPNLTEDWNDFSDSDVGMKLVALYAAIKDMQEYTLDKAFLENFISTVTQRQNLVLLSNTYGYTLRGYVASNGLVKKIGSTTSNLQLGDFLTYSDPFGGSKIKVVYMGETVSTSGGVGYKVYEGSPVKFGNSQNAFGSVVSDVDGNTLSGSGRVCIADDGSCVAIDDSLCFAGSSDNFESRLTDYIRVDSFIGLTSKSDYDENKVYFRVYVDYDNRTYLEFYDKTKVVDIPLWFHYVFTSGTMGSIANGLTVRLNDSALAGDAFETASDIIGGKNPESVEDARKNIPEFIRSVDRAVTYEDYMYWLTYYLKNKTGSYDGIQTAVNVADQYLNASVYKQSISNFPQVNNLVWIMMFNTIQDGTSHKKFIDDTSSTKYGYKLQYRSTPVINGSDYKGISDADLAEFISEKRMLGVMITGSDLSTSVTTYSNHLVVNEIRVDIALKGSASWSDDVKEALFSRLMSIYDISDNAFARRVSIFDLISTVMVVDPSFNTANFTDSDTKIILCTYNQSGSTPVASQTVATIGLYSGAVSEYEAYENQLVVLGGVTFI